MDESWDVVILGGGPGGSSLASGLAQRGLRALVLERDTFPRFHIGESLLPRSREVFVKLGLEKKIDERFLRKAGATFLCSATKRVNTYLFAEAFEAGTNFDFAYQVPRAEFDELLLRHAQELGAEVRERWECVEVIWEGERAVGVKARDLRHPDKIVEIEAKIVADATGRDALIASRRRKKTHVPGLDKTALFSHFTGAYREPGTNEGNIQIITFEHGWFWLIPFKGELTSFGAVVSNDWLKQRAKDESLDDFFWRTVKLSCWATDFLANAKQQRPVGALADFSYRIDQLAGDGWLFVGDAGGFLDPLFSTGAHLALKGAELAADAITAALASGDTSRAAFVEYEKSIRYAVDLFLGVVQAFYAGHFKETIFEPSQRMTMRRIITSILAGDVFHNEKRKPQWARFVQEMYPAMM